MVTDQPEQDGRKDLSVPDRAARVDDQLMRDLGQVNYHLAQYLLRVYDAVAGRAEPISITDELALAERFAAAAEVLRSRAARRWSASESLSAGSPADGELV